MHHTQGRKAGPGHLALRQLMPSQGRQHQHTGQQLDQRDQMRRRSAEAFDDQCRDRIEQRRPQRQGDAQQVVATGHRAPPVGTDDGQHADESQRQPTELEPGDALAEKQRRQAHQHERLDVVDHGADGDGGLRVRGEQQQPVTDDGHAAEHRQQQYAPPQKLGTQQAEHGADQQQHAAADQAAPEHHIHHGLAGYQDEPTDGAGNQHGGDHFQRTAFEVVIHEGSLFER